MKIQRLKEEHRAKAYALLRRSSPGSEYEALLVQKLHENHKPLQEWVCLHTGKAIAYIAFSTAFNGHKPCGLLLAPLAVAPEFQREEIGNELLRFALRQQEIVSQTLYVLGLPNYYKKFGFEPCTAPDFSQEKSKGPLLSMRNASDTSFTLSLEPEFKAAAKQARALKSPQTPKFQGKKRR